MNNIRFTEYGGFIFTFPALLWFMSSSLDIILLDTVDLFFIFIILTLLVCFLINIALQMLYIWELGNSEIYKGMLFWLNYFSFLLFIILFLLSYLAHHFGVFEF